MHQDGWLAEMAHPSDQVVVSSRAACSAVAVAVAETRQPFLPRDDVDQEVELVRLGECFRNVCAGQCTTFVRICDNECTRCDFRYKNCVRGQHQNHICGENVVGVEHANPTRVAVLECDMWGTHCR